MTPAIETAGERPGTPPPGLDHADATPASVAGIPTQPGAPGRLPAAPAPAPVPTRAGSGGRLALALLLLGQFMAILDVSIVNVALPTLRTDLHTSDSGLQLVVAGYILSYAVLLITGARLGGILGHRRTFLTGLAVFTVASLACGLAPGSGSLIAFRFVQGAGAALMTPQVMSLIQRTFTGAARARALGLFTAVVAGGVVGQAAGGLLVSADIAGTGWRPVFLLNVPIGVALLIAGPRSLPRDHGERGEGLDIPGLLVMSPAVLLVVLPLILGHDEGWPAWCVISIIAGVALFGPFIAVERRIAAQRRRPLISGQVLRVPRSAARGRRAPARSGDLGRVPVHHHAAPAGRFEDDAAAFGARVHPVHRGVRGKSALVTTTPGPKQRSSPARHADGGPRPCAVRELERLPGGLAGIDLAVVGTSGQARGGGGVEEDRGVAV
jgi:MFS family permease